MQIGNKRTALKDNAALYTHETDGLTDKEIMKSLKGRKKWIQFRDYYLMKIIAIMAVLAFVGSLLYTMLKPKPKTIFYAAVCDMTVDPDNRDLIEKDFQEYVGIDKEKEDILFDSAYYFETDEVSSQQKLAVYTAVGQISVVIMPESRFKLLAENSFFKPLSEVLSTEDYLKLTKRFAMSGIRGDNDEIIPDSEKAYGIYVDGCKYIMQGYKEPIVIAVSAGWEDNKIITDFIEFLFK